MWRTAFVTAVIVSLTTSVFAQTVPSVQQLTTPSSPFPVFSGTYSAAKNLDAIRSTRLKELTVEQEKWGKKLKGQRRELVDLAKSLDKQNLEVNDDLDKLNELCYIPETQELWSAAKKHLPDRRAANKKLYDASKAAAEAINTEYLSFKEQDLKKQYDGIDTIATQFVASEKSYFEQFDRECPPLVRDRPPTAKSEPSDAVSIDEFLDHANKCLKTQNSSDLTSIQKVTALTEGIKWFAGKSFSADARIVDVQPDKAPFCVVVFENPLRSNSFDEKRFGSKSPMYWNNTSVRMELSKEETLNTKPNETVKLVLSRITSSFDADAILKIGDDRLPYKISHAQIKHEPFTAKLPQETAIIEGNRNNIEPREQGDSFPFTQRLKPKDTPPPSGTTPLGDKNSATSPSNTSSSAPSKNAASPQSTNISSQTKLNSSPLSTPSISVPNSPEKLAQKRDAERAPTATRSATKNGNETQWVAIFAVGLAVLVGIGFFLVRNAR